ncbi:MAG: SGNH/GDSL hydrolase family protein [Pigmentiphaga sp.]|nr:SGNH/GDSL hydrolase family protein [Pigmentiphaga sp.]
MNKLLKYLLVIIIAAGVGVFHAGIEAQTFVLVHADNPDIVIEGAQYLTKTPERVIINRHSEEFFPLVTGYFLEARAKTQTGVVIRFKTDSPQLKVNFEKRNDSEQRNNSCVFAVYKNGKLSGYIRDTYQLNITAGTTDPVVWEIVLPYLWGVNFTGIDLVSGYTLLPQENENKPKYVAIGNSITHGTGQTDASDVTYAFRFARAMGWELYNLAVGGSRIHEQIAEETKNLDLHAISILWGFNDWTQTQPSVLMANVMPRYKLLLENLREYHPDAYIYCIMPTHTTNPRTPTIDTLRNAERRIVKEMIAQGDDRFIVVEGGSVNNTADLTDNVHLNNQGASKLADFLIAAARNKVEGGNVEAYQLPFQETFTGTTTATTYNTGKLNASLSTTQGWQIEQSITRTPVLTPGVAVSTISEGGYLRSPEIDIPSGTPINIFLNARMALNDSGTDAAEKQTNNNHRNFYITIGNDTVYDHQKISYSVAPRMQNPGVQFLGSYIYEGNDPATLKFFASNDYQGVWADKSDGFVMINSRVTENNDLVPAINIPYGTSKDLGMIDLNITSAGSTIQRTFPLKGINLIQDVVFSDSESNTVKLPVKVYSPDAGSIDEDVTVVITVPAEEGIYTEKITVTADANGPSMAAPNKITDLIQPTRTLWFTYSVDAGTGVHLMSNPATITAHNQVIRIHSTTATNVKVYNLSGVLLHHLAKATSADIPVNKGVYVVKTESVVTKVVL